jgi:hypothetical protein
MTYAGFGLRTPTQNPAREPWRAQALACKGGLAAIRPRMRAQKSGLSAFGISETDASNAMLFSAQMASSIAPVIGLPGGPWHVESARIVYADRNPQCFPAFSQLEALDDMKLAHPVRHPLQGG